MKLSATRLLALLAIGWGLPAGACNVPVFRYALERWPADPYVLTVLYQGEMSPADKAVVEALKKTGETTANLEIDAAEIRSALPGFVLERFGGRIRSMLPLVLVDYPERDQIPRPAWWSRLSAPAAKLMVDSPARRELARRLLKGESAVWMLLESGDASADAGAAKLLDQTLAKLEKELKLPEPDPDDPRTNANVSLTIKFSSLRIGRQDPAETVLVSMLRNIDPSLLRARGPIVFPVFGRGRILAGLTGETLNEEMMERAATFIIGACSCEAKSQNPGIDLLLAADWDALIEGRAVKDPELPPLIGLSQFVAPAVAPAGAVSTLSASPAVVELKPQGSLVRNVLIVVGAGVIVLGATALVMRRKTE